MKPKKNNRGFGLLFFIVFLLIGLWPLLKGDNPRIYFFPIAFLFLVLGIINSKILFSVSSSDGSKTKIISYLTLILFKTNRTLSVNGFIFSLSL